MKSLVFLAVLGLACSLAIPSKQYSGHQVLKVHIENELQLQVFKKVSDEMLLDIWKRPKTVPGVAHVRVSDFDKQSLLDKLQLSGLRHQVIIEDIQTLIDAEQVELASRTIFEPGHHPATITIDQYHNLNEIHAFLDSVGSTFGSIATVGSFGKSFEGRDLKYVKIGKSGSNKKAAFINGCAHAREWLACSSVVYIVNELTSNSSKYDELLSKLDIYILPVFNPDGYVYSWTTTYRLWRKTRSGPRNGCYGVDPNRNWSYKWGVAGFSKDPCAEHYDGPSANSEVEVKALSTFLAANNASIKAFIDIHTYYEDLLYPFGYAEVYPVDVDKIKKVAGDATNAINKVNGENFTYGSVFDAISPDSGTAIDYAKGMLNIDYTYEMDLRPGRNATNGFVLPADQIIPGAAECWAGLQVVFKAAYDTSQSSAQSFNAILFVFVSALFFVHGRM